MLQDSLASSIDALLAITSTELDQARALDVLERTIASLVVEVEVVSAQRDDDDASTCDARLDAFLALQDQFEYNLASVLLNWLGRTIAMLSAPANVIDADLTRSNLTRCLGLLQGLLLLHRRSQRLFVRRSALECLLAVLDLSRPSHLSSPLLAHLPPSPSPIHLPSSSTPSPSLSTPRAPPSSLSNSTSPNPSHLALVALDSLLCALVDRPENMRTFESVGGLATIVKVLKDKSVAQSVRIKVIELLYYYLLPETQSIPERPATPTTPTSSTTEDRCSTPPSSTRRAVDRSLMIPPDQLAHATQGFIPQTPHKTKPTPQSGPVIWEGGVGQRSSSSSSSSSNKSREDDSPSRTPRRRPPPGSPTKSREGVKLEDHDRTPRGRMMREPNCPSRGVVEDEGGGGTSRRSSSSRRPIATTTKTTTKTTSLIEEGRMTRTTVEKVELLRRVMPNVDALEERFRAMGLGFGYARE